MTRLLSAVLVLSVVPAASGSPEVMEEEVTLSCCGSPTLTFTEDCEIQWTINEESFAIFNNGTQCIPPCKKMEGGRMSLDSCLSLNATVVCTDESGQVKEKSIKYLHKECSSRSDARAHGHLVSSVLVLLAVIIGGLMVKKTTS